MPVNPSGSVQPYSTGVTFVYLGVGSSGTPAFFGTAESYPKHERRVDIEYLMNDVGGRKKPVDVSFQGMDASLSLTMTVWDEGVAQILENLPRFELSPNTSPPGTWSFADMGTLMAFEGYAIPIWLQYNYAKKAAYSKLAPGYHYYNALPLTLGDENGAAPMKRIFSFYVWPATNFSAKTQTLFDYNMTGLPTPVGSIL